MTNNRYTFKTFGRMRKRQYNQQKWIYRMDLPYFVQNGSAGNHAGGGSGGGGGYSILWELKNVDRKIQRLQSEIYVLKQQLKIIQTKCVTTEQQSEHHSLRYISFRCFRCTYSAVWSILFLSVAFTYKFHLFALLLHFFFCFVFFFVVIFDTGYGQTSSQQEQQIRTELMN